MASAHPGFKSVAANIAKKQGLPMARANAILAFSSKHASAGAKKKNPRLKKVGPVMRRMGKQKMVDPRTGKPDDIRGRDSRGGPADDIPISQYRGKK